MAQFYADENFDYPVVKRLRVKGHVRNRKAQTRLLLRALRKRGLIGPCVGHRYRRAVDQLHFPTAPPPQCRLRLA